MLTFQEQPQINQVPETPLNRGYLSTEKILKDSEPLLIERLVNGISQDSVEFATYLDIVLSTGADYYLRSDVMQLTHEILSTTENYMADNNTPEYLRERLCESLQNYPIETLNILSKVLPN